MKYGGTLWRIFLYALAEMQVSPPFRRFVFANWDDDDPAFLEVEAREFNCDGSTS